MKNGFYGIILLLGSIILSLIIGEGVLRLAVEPIDYLAPQLVADPILGFRSAPKSGHHDAWGFRNHQTPSQADIVTIGDSQTYGAGEECDHTWPAILERITGKSVYNLSLSGYGPPQYLYLLENYALKLKPRFIVLGFYCGNDFSDSYVTVHGLDYWKDLRDPEFTADSLLNRRMEDIVEVNQPEQVLGVKRWLEQHSILYRLASSVSNVSNYIKIKESPKMRLFTYVNDEKHNIHTGFKPVHRHKECDVSDRCIQEGERITFLLLDRMIQTCRSQGIDFSLVLIPTKELVFSDYFESNRNIQNIDIIKDIIANEVYLDNEVTNYCRARKIPYAEPLAAMQALVGHVDIYPNDLNDHPSQKGYAVIAESVRECLNLIPKE